MHKIYLVLACGVTQGLLDSVAGNTAVLLSYLLRNAKHWTEVKTQSINMLTLESMKVISLLGRWLHSLGNLLKRNKLIVWNASVQTVCSFCYFTLPPNHVSPPSWNLLLAVREESMRKRSTKSTSLSEKWHNHHLKAKTRLPAQAGYTYPVWRDWYCQPLQMGGDTLSQDLISTIKLNKPKYNSETHMVNESRNTWEQYEKKKKLEMN